MTRNILSLAQGDDSLLYREFFALCGRSRIGRLIFEPIRENVDEGGRESFFSRRFLDFVIGFAVAIGVARIVAVPLILLYESPVSRRIAVDHAKEKRCSPTILAPVSPVHNHCRVKGVSGVSFDFGKRYRPSPVSASMAEVESVCRRISIRAEFRFQPFAEQVSVYLDMNVILKQMQKQPIQVIEAFRDTSVLVESLFRRLQQAAVADEELAARIELVIEVFARVSQVMIRYEVTRVLCEKLSQDIKREIVDLRLVEFQERETL